MAPAKTAGGLEAAAGPAARAAAAEAESAAPPLAVAPGGAAEQLTERERCRLERSRRWRDDRQR